MWATIPTTELGHHPIPSAKHRREGPRSTESAGRGFGNQVTGAAAAGGQRRSPKAPAVGAPASVPAPWGPEAKQKRELDNLRKEVAALKEVAKQAAGDKDSNADNEEGTCAHSKKVKE